MYVSMTDEQLVTEALNDIEAFGALIDRYESRLMGYVLRISSFRVEEVEEILQEVFVKAWKNLRGFDSSLKFSSWLYRIAHNETISSFRKYKSRGQDQTVSWNPELFDFASDELEISAVLDVKTRAARVHAALEQLKPAYREILVLKYLEDQSYEEMSDILKKPMGTVATLLNRAKKAFKVNYNPLNDD